ncbi:MAG: hypothetical protein ABSF76_15450 [Opitutaceae bacterium]
MKTACAQRIAPWVLVAAAMCAVPGARGQSGQYSTESIELGSGGYVVNFGVTWTCDDDPQATASAPGEVDLVDANGNIAAEVVATADYGEPVVTVTGAGSVAGAGATINLQGAGGTPADGHLHATWNISGLPAGPYTLRFWDLQRFTQGNPISTITTVTLDNGGGGAVGATPTPTPTPAPSPSPTPTPSPSPSPTPSPTPSPSPTATATPAPTPSPSPTPTPSPTATPTPQATPTPSPTPTPTPVPANPPSVSVSGPPSAQAFQSVTLGATATMPAGGNPLALVVIDLSVDGGNTWTRIASDNSPQSPTDAESVSFRFSSAGTAILRGTATDSQGLSGNATLTLAIAKADQSGVSISPSVASATAGQTLLFTASGGATGGYAWGGSASGTGVSTTVAFPAPGTFTLTVVDMGNSGYNPSPAASATVNVQPAFYTLTLLSSPGGTVSGGGSYAPNAVANAVATAAPGNSFAGWTGDLTGASSTMAVVMSSNKSLTANFVALLPQTISLVAPSAVTTRSAAFTLSAASSSGLPVALALLSGPASLLGTTLTPTGAVGVVTLTATQQGNSQYLPAPPVVLSFPIGLPPPGVIFADDASATKRSDRKTRTTSYTSIPAH